MGAARSRSYAPLLAPLALLALGLSGACGGSPESGAGGSPGDEPAPHPSWRRARLVVADASSRELELIDVEFGESVARLELDAVPTELVVTHSGEHVLAATAEGARLIYAGVAVLDHSEGASDSAEPHLHVYKYPPSLLELGFDLASPRVASAARASAVSSGDEAQALLFEDASLFDDAPPSPVRLEGLRAGAGPVLPIEGGFLVETAAGVAHLVRAEASSSTPEHLADCADVGARASVAARAAFACDQALLFVDASSGASPATVSVGLPAPLDERASIALHVDRSDVLVATPEGAWIVAANGTTPLALALPSRACDLGFEPAHAESVTALAADGVLYQLDASTGALLHQAAVVEPFDCESPLRPRLAQAPQRAYVSVPSGARILELRLDDGLSALPGFDTAVVPALIVVAGIDVDDRNLGELD